MNFPALLVGFTAASLLGTAVVAAPAAAVPRPDASLAASPSADSGPTVSDPVDAALSPALRDLPVSSPPANPGEVPEGQPDPGTVPGGDQPGAANDSGSAQREIAGDAPADLVPVNSFAGGTADSYAGQSTLFTPPDTVGDVGPNHYVQMVNVTYQIWDKQGTSLAGPTNINALWSGLPAGTPCRQTNDGDPIVLYDQAADRWMLAQFSVRGTGYQMCIAYSTTPDPTGTYYTYAFDMPNFPDYEKFGIWPDGLYMSTYDLPDAGGSFLGAYVFDRTQMLSGLAATYQRFEISAAGGPRERRILPADWDGATTPPAGAPNPFVMSVDAQVQDGAEDRLELYNFHVDWATPTDSTFTLDQTLPTDPFNVDIGSDCMGNVAGSFRECVPQPGTTVKVDDLSNRLMWRLQYRNFGDHQAMVTNQTVNSGNNTAALRWYELRSTGTSWTIHQQNTFAPAGNDYRWMGSAALDGKGNIALGYSISNATDLFPSINYTGQRVGAPVNQLSEPETRMFTGVASQTVNSRWGDYSAMSVDPVDECTFWYTQMHIGTGGTRQTRIGTAQFTSCAQPTGELRLKKVVTGDNSANGPAAWNLTATAAAPLEGKNFTVAGDNDGFAPVFAGTPYALTEAGPNNYTGTWECVTDNQLGTAAQTKVVNGGNTVTVPENTRVTCTLTNDRDTARLKLVKKIEGGPAKADDWTLTAKSVAPLDDKNISTPGGSGQSEVVYAGAEYTLAESGPGGYTAGDWVCLPDADDVRSRAADAQLNDGDKIKLMKGQQVTCTIVNTRDLGSLTITKEFNPQASGYTGTFAINYTCVDGAATVKQGTVSLAAGTSQTIAGVPNGSACTVTEPQLPANPKGWAFNPPTFSPASGQVTVSGAGQSVAVTVINSISATSPSGAKRTCPIDVTLHKPQPTKAGNQILTDKIKTKNSSCVLLKPIVLCRSLATTTAGERAFCETRATKKGRIAVKTNPDEPVRITVIVRVKPKPGFSDRWKPNSWRKSWRLT